MFVKIVSFCAVVAVSSAGLLPAAINYSPASAVSSQSIVRQSLGNKVLASPLGYGAVAAPIAYSSPIAKVIAQPEVIAYPKYQFAYSVADALTGDKKQQQEIRDGDVVKGSYSLLEADGSIRTVQYSADDHNGFNAIVQNTAPVVKAAPLIAPLIKSPLIVKSPAYY